MPSDPQGARRRPSSHLRLSSTATLYGRLRAAQIVVDRRWRQLAAVEVALSSLGIAVPGRSEISNREIPEAPAQFGPWAGEKRQRSAALVAAAIEHLKATTHKSKSPGKKKIAEATKLASVVAKASEDFPGKLDCKGVTINVFRTNQECLDLYLAACLPKHAEGRKAVAVPSWAVRLDHDVLIDMVIDTEQDRDQLTRDVMAANELFIAPEVSRIRKDVVRIKAERMTLAVG